MVDEQLIAVTISLVALVKKLTDLDGKLVVLISFVVGGILAGVKQYLPEFYDQNLAILLTGLVASGVYTVAKGAGTGVIDRINGNGGG